MECGKEIQNNGSVLGAYLVCGFGISKLFLHGLPHVALVSIFPSQFKNIWRF